MVTRIVTDPHGVEVVATGLSAREAATLVKEQVISTNCLSCAATFGASSAYHVADRSRLRLFSRLSQMRQS